MTPTSEGPDGVLVVDKPDGPTSHDVVARARWALRTKRVGHAGTLDPFATGLLLLCVGRATRLAGLLTASMKTYEGLIRFGFATDSGDRTGTPLGEPVETTPDIARLRELASAHLTGEIDQVPPMHSAKKQGGVSLHRLARRGEVVDRPAVRVSVSDWRLEPTDGSLVRFEVTCSAGTYVRVLASELGELAGIPAHLESLRRTRSGSFTLEGALKAGDLTRESAPSALIPIDAVPLPMDSVTLGESDALGFRHGRAIALPGADVERLAVRDESGRLLGIGRRHEGHVRAGAVLAPIEG
jgi:tRNA pseudouridine55 synthase